VPVNGLAIRGALLVLALLAGVWLAFGIQSVLLQDDADAVLAQARKGPVSPKQVDAAVHDYQQARRLSPDQTPLISEGQLLLAAGRRREAQEVSIRAIQEEPDNLQTWFFGWVAAEALKNPQGVRTAKAHILKLNPWFLYVLTRKSPTP
jgi:predicted Zn-dependent protease